MREWMLGGAVVLAIACSSNTSHSVDSGTDSKSARTCTGSAFDPCTTADQCTSMNCHAYGTSGFTVCTQACTPGDNSTCPVDSTGSNGFCNNMGNCKPAKPNDCVP